MGKTPRLTVRCEYPGSDSPPDEVTFRLSPRYGIHTPVSQRFRRCWSGADGYFSGLRNSMFRDRGSEGLSCTGPSASSIQVYS